MAKWNTITVVLQTKWSIEPFATHWKSRTWIWTNLGSENSFFYRNKMEFSFQTAVGWLKPKLQVQEGNRNALGFISKMWDKILDINKCHLQEDPSNAIRNEVRDFANANDFLLTQSHEVCCELCCYVSSLRRNHGFDSVFLKMTK
jgi:tRNA/tmRNA/rRNA uracil-C5-methylase (TrmA/RlmC/RlmD family)